MPDNKDFFNPEDLSLDTLLEETKQQINSVPGEAMTPIDDVTLYRPVDEADLYRAEEAPSPEVEDFEPDFGNAFADYGEYEEPESTEPTENFEDDDPGDDTAAQEDDPADKPKRSTGKRLIPLFVKIILYVVIVAVSAVGIGYGAWECAKDVLAFGRSDEMVEVVVNEGDTIDDVAQMLKDRGVIKYPWLFKLYCSFTDSAEEIEPNKAGESYTLYYNYDYHALVAEMHNVVTRTEIRVTIPEGYTAAQIFELMESKQVCTAEELAESAASYNFDYWFLEGIPYGEENRLEGFLFPDTYDFYEDDDPERVLDKLLSNFNRKFGDDAKRKLNELNNMLYERWTAAGVRPDYVEDNLFTVYELITVASMIEKEAAAYDEAGMISSVIYNRLCSPSEYPYLNIDATVVYALGGTVDGALSYDDLKVDSPYNTYVVKGLPVGPIANPGLSSISAALYPTESDYYYYALDPATGRHHFTKTYYEHNKFLEGLNNAN